MKPACEKLKTVSIRINEQRQSVDEDTSIAQLLHQLKISNPAVAVEVNLELVPRTQFATTILKDEDRVEIVALSGGG